MTTERIRVAVVGAGIAGLTVAAALARSGPDFRDCQVFEQADELAEVGAGIQLAPNASRLLHRLGLAGHLRRQAVAPEALTMRRWDDGSTLMRNRLGDQCERMFGAPYYAVHRAHLHRGLLDLVPAGSVHLGRRCVAAEQRDSDVLLHFADGSSVAAELVVAADGIHSVLRGLLSGERTAEEPRFSGQMVYRGLVPAGRVPFIAEHPAVNIWLGPGQHFVCYPVAAGRLVSFAATAPTDDGRVESWHTEGSVRRLLSIYSGWHRDLLDVVSAADSVRTWALHDRDPVPAWSAGRITLVGDAAHPMLPFGAQGGAQGIEDAMALAACLRSAGPDRIGDALARYQAARAPRVAQVLEFVRSNARNHHYSDGEQQHRRDSAMDEDWGLRSQEWLFGYDAERVVEEVALSAGPV